MNKAGKTIMAVSIFSIAMAALESAVVVYLRELYYPDQFTVALKVISTRILLIELAREAATLVMLSGVGYLAGKNFKERLAYFLLSFAIWDIFYYIWLKVFIGWPSSVFEWDILFLIPITWLGPVLAPVICSITMIVLAAVLLRTDCKFSPAFWSLLLAGCAVILYTFIRDYASILISNGFLKDYANLLQNQDFLKIASTYIPQSYSWGLFWIGELLIALGIFAGLYRIKWKINLAS